MKFIEKIKNYFYDEEDVEDPKKVDLKQEQPPSKNKIESKEDKRGSTKNNIDLDVVSERELFRSEPTFNFPIIFDEEDFKEEKMKKARINITKEEKTKIEEKVEKKAFKPSPNISPVYGIINLNSKGEKDISDTSDNLFNLYEEDKKVDIDDVLGKVYSEKRVELKRENYKEIEVENIEQIKEDLSIDLFNNIGINIKEEEKTEIEVKTESTNDIDEKLKTIDELLESTDEEDFYSLVDSMYKEKDKEGDK